MTEICPECGESEWTIEHATWYDFDTEGMEQLVAETFRVCMACGYKIMMRSEWIDV